MLYFPTTTVRHVYLRRSFSHFTTRPLWLLYSDHFASLLLTIRFHFIGEAKKYIQYTPTQLQLYALGVINGSNREDFNVPQSRTKYTTSVDVWGQ